MVYKPEIRDKMQKRRSQLDKVSVVQASQAVAAVVVVLKEFLEAQHIGAYIPIQNELETYPILQAAESLHKKLFLPAFRQGKPESEPTNILTFFPYALGDALQNGKGFPQPAHSVIREAKDLDLILLPLVAFDAYCNRVGRGAGHYDRALAFLNPRHSAKKPFLLGLGYEFQKIPPVKLEKWDVPMDMVVTEKNTYTR